MRFFSRYCNVILLFCLAAIVNCDDGSRETAKIILGEISTQKEADNQRQSLARTLESNDHKVQESRNGKLASLRLCKLRWKNMRLIETQSDNTFSVTNKQSGGSWTPSGAVEIISDVVDPAGAPPPRRLIKRALGRSRLSKVALAPRPKSTTTTTTTTEKPTQEASAEESEETEYEQEEEEVDKMETPKEEPKQPASFAKSKPPANANNNLQQIGSNEKKGRKKQPTAAATKRLVAIPVLSSVSLLLRDTECSTKVTAC